MSITEPDSGNPYSTPKSEIHDKKPDELSAGGVFLTASICLLALSALTAMVFFIATQSDHALSQKHFLLKLPLVVAFYTGVSYLFGALPLYLYATWYADSANKEAIGYGASIGMAALVSIFIFGVLGMIHNGFFLLLLAGLLHGIPTSALCHYIYTRRQKG